MENENETLDPSTDELWQAAKDEETLPDDDTDLETDELEEEDDEDGDDTPAPAAPAAAALDEEALYQRFAERFEKERSEQIIQAANARLKQSIEARDNNIKKMLAPLAKHLQEQEQQGLFTRADSQQAYAKAYQDLATQEQAQEQRQAQANQAQQWLAQRNQTSNPQAEYVQPAWAKDWEALMTQRLNATTLVDGDPELEKLPLKQMPDGSMNLDITHPNGSEAYAYVDRLMATLEAQKAQRLGQAAPAAQPKKKPFPVDMGSGAGGSGSNKIANVDDPDQLWELAKGWA